MIELWQDAPKGATEITVRTYERLAQFIMTNLPNTYFTVGNTTLQVLAMNPAPNLPDLYRILFASKLPIGLTKLTQFTATINEADYVERTLSIEDTLTFTQAIEYPDIRSDILVFYKWMNETYTDSSGNGHNLFLTPPVTWTTPGPNTVDSSVTFTGGKFTQPDNMGDTSGDITISTWVKPSESWNGLMFAVIYDAVGWIECWATQEEDMLRAVYKLNGGITEESFPMDDDWYLFTFTRSGTSAKLYIDGVEVSSTNSWTQTGVGVLDMVLGLDISSNLPWIGSLANFLIYNRALTADEVSALVAVDNDPYPIDLTTGLFGFYPMNGNLNDTSGNNRHMSGTIDSTANDSPAGYGSRFISGGSGPYLSGSYTVPSSLHSVFMWVKPIASSLGYDNVLTLQFNTVYVNIRFRKSDNSIELICNPSNDSVIYTGSVSETTWYHVGYVRTPSQYRLYVNGNLVASRANNIIGTALTNIQFSGSLFGGAYTRENAIANCAIWTRALELREIRKLYLNNGSV